MNLPAEIIARAAAETCWRGAPSKPGMRRSLFAVLAAMTLAGCAAHAPRHYVLTPDALTPPAVRQPLRVNGVAQRSCEISSGPLKATARRHNLYLRRAAGEISDATLRDFRARLFRMETDGCLVMGGAQRGAAALADLLALPSSSLYLARYGVAHDSASIDIEPGFFVKVVSPLLRAGSKDMQLEAKIPEQQGAIHVKASADLEGFETSYYGVEAIGSAVVFRLVLVEHNRSGKIASAAIPAGFRLEPPAAARNFRMLFLRRRSDSDRNLTMLGAGSRAELDAAQQRMESAADPMAACRDERPAWCQPIPRLSAIAPVFRATVNGKSVFVHIHGAVSEAIRAAGLTPQEGAWMVERPWQGHLLPVVVTARPEALLDLVLLGGERITASTR